MTTVIGQYRATTVIGIFADAPDTKNAPIEGGRADEIINYSRANRPIIGRVFIFDNIGRIQFFRSRTCIRQRRDHRFERVSMNGNNIMSGSKMPVPQTGVPLRLITRRIAWIVSPFSASAF